MDRDVKPLEIPEGRVYVKHQDVYVCTKDDAAAPCLLLEASIMHIFASLCHAGLPCTCIMYIYSYCLEANNSP